jgi:aquaporin Z
MKKYIMELVGTFMFVLSIALVVISGTEFAPIAIGLSLAILVYASSHVSGGHLNPAVSLAVWMRGKMPTSDLIPYWIAQIGG